MSSFEFQMFTHFLPKTKRSGIGFSWPQNLFLTSEALGLNLGYCVFLLHVIFPRYLLHVISLHMCYFQAKQRTLRKIRKWFFISDRVSSQILAELLARLTGEDEKKWGCSLPWIRPDIRPSSARFWHGFRFSCFRRNFVNPFEFKFMFGLGNS